MPTERVQKILARAGVASRRAAERMIAEGRVRVNGRIVTELGTKADTIRDRVEVDGKRVVAEHPVYYVLHKPREVITTLDDPEQRENVAQLMKGVNERVFPIGRLDYHTSGALLMTNDGDMSQALLHPKKRVPKVYVAKLKGDVALGNIQRLREGVVLDDGQQTAKADVFIVNEERGNTWLQLTITEGKNRQVHRMAEAIGHRVQRLFRMSFAGINVDGMRPGEYRMLTDTEISKLKRDYLNPSQREKSEQAKEARRERLGMGPSLSEKRSYAPRHPRRATAGMPAVENSDAQPQPARHARKSGARPRKHAQSPAQPERLSQRQNRFDKSAPRPQRDATAARPERFARNAATPGPARNAASARPDRFTRSKSAPRSDRDASSPARPDRFTRGKPTPRPDRDAAPARPDRFARNKAAPRPDRDASPARPERFARGKTAPRPDRDASPARPDRFTRGKPVPRPDRDASPARPERFTRNKPAPRPDRDAAPARPARFTRNKPAPRPDRADPAPRQDRTAQPQRFARNAATPRPAPSRKSPRPRKPTRTKTS